MGCKIYVSKKGFLVYRLHWNKQNSWEGTTLRDTPANRKRVEQDADLISREITAGRFDYGRWFPAGNKMPKAEAVRQGWTVREYYDKWILQQRPPLVRKSSERDYKQHFTRYILPRFGETELATIATRAHQVASPGRGARTENKREPADDQALAECHQGFAGRQGAPRHRGGLLFQEPPARAHRC